MEESVSPLRFQESPPNKSDFFALFESTGWNEEYQLTSAELAQAIRQSWYFVAAYDRDKLVGTGRIVSDGVCHALILDVIVRPEYRRRAIGTVIMRRLLEHCRQKRVRDIQLFCASGKMEFYRKLGFVSRPDDAPGMDYRPTAPCSSTGDSHK